MRRVHTGLVLAPLGLLLLLSALDATVGLAAAGWVAAVTAGAVGAGTLQTALTRRPWHRLSRADAVTLTRAVLVGGVTALVAGGLADGRATHGSALSALAAVALVLDAVDGWVARRSGTATELGARLDMEVDAFLILVLSAEVGRSTAWWVLGLGAARYLLVGAGRLQPWLRAPLPPRFWGKVVAAYAGVALTVAAAGVLPATATLLVLLVAAALLAESFGRQVRDLWRLRGAGGGADGEPVGPAEPLVAAGLGERP